MNALRKVLLLVALVGLLSGCGERQMMIREARLNTPVEQVR